MVVLTSSFSVFQKPLKPIAAIHTYFHLSRAYATISLSCIPISTRFFTILSIHYCFGLPSDIFPLIFHFWTTFLIHQISIRGQYIQLFYIATLLLYRALCVVIIKPKYIFFGIIKWYYSFSVCIFSLGFFFSKTAIFFFPMIVSHTSYAYKRIDLMPILYKVFFYLSNTLFDLNLLASL